MQLQEPLSDRSAWSMIGRCPVEKAMQVVGSRNALLTVREAFYGTTRFDDFASRVGMSAATTSANLRALTEAGLLARRPYRDAGARTREEYALTEAGADLVPVLLALFAWSSKHVDSTSVELTHADCGEQVHVQVVCDAGHPVAAEQIQVGLTPPADGAGGG